MLRESHTIAKIHSIALSLLTLLAVGPALAPFGADAFSFGRHHKGDAVMAQPAAQPAADQAKPAADQAKPAPDAKYKGPEIIHRKDFSGSFSFVLPEGWRTYQIPYQPHDVLSLHESDDQSATISFADELGKHDLEKLKDSTVDKNKKLLQKYELVEAKMLALASGQPCAKIVSLGQIDEVDTRQVQYIFSLKKKHFLVATLTVTKPVGEKYDKLLQDVVASISTNLEPAKTTK